MKTQRLGRTNLDISILSIGGLYTSSLGGGVPETCRQQQLLAYYKLLDEAGISALELCLRFAISDADIASIPIGCKTVEQLDACAAAVAKGPLPPDMLSRIDQIAAMVPLRPYEEPMILPLGKKYYGPGIANMGAAVQVGKPSSLP
jgi:aryl-alcohol dehydrogenase-like predicted oxidoreductase